MGLSAGSRHTSNVSARLMKLCGVIELCQEVRYARDVVGWAMDMVSGDVVEVPGGGLKCRVSLSQSAASKKAGRSDHGEMDGNCLQVVDERTRSEPRNAIHAAMRANLEYLNSK